MSSTLRPSQIEEALEALDGRGSDAEFAAVKRLAALGGEFPALLLAKYQRSSKLAQRASCVYHATRYVKASDAAYQLGIEALRDKSKVVRYRACLLLAVAQRRDAIPALKALRDSGDATGDATAAIDAIESGNRHYFVDRDHSGAVTLTVAHEVAP